MLQHAVILAGGSGTRLWPASTGRFPKQFLDLGKGQTLFMMTLLRALSLGLKGDILIVAHRDQIPEIEKQCGRIAEIAPPGSNKVLIIPEPEAKNTAPAIALAACALKSRGEAESILLILPADHSIDPPGAFAADVQKAFHLAGQGYLVTFGITPIRAETGYGYIEVGEPLKWGFKVKRFKEKPDVKRAGEFMQSGTHYWNSGMFAYRAGTLLKELENHSPEVALPFLEADFNFQAAAGGEAVIFSDPEAATRVYAQIPSISVDYALMEKSKHSAMVQASFNWSDIGSWDEVSRLFGGESEQVFSIASEKNFVYSDLPVALGGVEDLLVVVKNGVVLIAGRGRSQLVKEIVSQVRSRGREELL